MQQPFVFQKTAVTALMLDKEDKYVALSDKKKRMWWPRIETGGGRL